MYPKEQIRAIAQRTDLVSLVGQYVLLKKRGKTYSGLCPFHKEKTPSFHVDSLKGFYHCFGCGAHGDAIKFLIDNGNLTFLEAVERLALLQGIELKKEKIKKTSINPSRLFLEKAKDFFLQQLKNLSNTAPAKKYLEKRNFSLQTLEKFEIGYALESWNALLKILKPKSLEELVSVGLVKKSEKTGSYYDFFRDRIIFPFRDYQGALIGFAGRSISDENIPKYLNSPDIELFHKNSFFYGLFQAKEAILKKGRSILVEGYTDVLRMHEAGFKETLAVAGTSLTDKHIEKLKQRREKIIFLFDSDAAGIAAVLRSAYLTLQQGLEAKIAFLPQAKDPDEFLLKNSAQEMEKILESATPVLTFILEKEKNKFKETNDLSQKDNIIKNLLEQANKINSESKQNIFLNEISSYFQMDFSVLQKKFQQNKRIDTTTREELFFKENTSSLQKAIQNTKESKIVGSILKNPTHFPILRKTLVPQDFLDSRLQKLMQRMFSMKDEEIVACSLADFLQLFSDDQEIVNSILICTKDLPEDNSEIFWLEKWIYELKKNTIHQKFSKESLYLSMEEQKEQWQSYKLQLNNIKHLISHPKSRRTFFKSKAF